MVDTIEEPESDLEEGLGALWTDANECFKEITAGQEYAKEFLTGWDEEMANIVGPYYRGGGGSTDDAPGTAFHNFKYVSTQLPQMAFSLPRVRVRSKREANSDTANAMEKGLNRWVKDFSYGSFSERVAMYLLMRWVVVLITLDEHPSLTSQRLPDELKERFADDEEDAKPSWPTVQTLALTDFSIDPTASHKRTARFQSHRWRMRHEDLKKLAKKKNRGWRSEVIENMTTTTDKEELGTEGRQIDMPDRGMVACWTVWVPEESLLEAPWTSEPTTPENGYHGVLYTLSRFGGDDGGEWGWIRDPVPFYGPKDGPYVMGGVYDVPEEVYPLSPMVAWQKHAELAGDASDVLLKEAREYKNVTVMDGSQAEVKDAIDNAKHQSTLLVEGFDPARVANYSQGGIQKESAAYYMHIDAELKSASGFDEQQQGMVDAQGTATAASIADSSAQNRAAWTRRANTAVHAEVLDRVGEYIWREETIVFQLGPGEGWFAGGSDEEDEGSWEDQELVIEPESMGRTDEGATQQRKLLGLEHFYALVDRAMMTPPGLVDFDKPAELLGEVFNMPGLSEWADFEALGHAGQQQAMLASQAGGGGGSPSGTTRSMQIPNSGRVQAQGLQQGGMLAAAAKG